MNKALKDAIKAEVRLQVEAQRQGRLREADKSIQGRAAYARKDLGKARSEKGVAYAPQYLGYVKTELQAIGRENGNSTATALAQKLSGAISQLSQIDKLLEQIGVQLRQWEES